MANRIQLRRDGAQQWANVNPVLAQGELGIELDTSRLKIGDGVTPWNSLKYERPLETESNTANTLVKRDADGNFEAGAINATLIGNAATATRLANARNFTLTGDMSGSASFDGSANINITAELNFQPGLPHYDENDLNATGTYTRLVIDSRGRVVTGDNPSTLTDYGIGDAQPLSSDLTAITGITTIGMLTRTGTGAYATRQVTGAPGRIVTSNANGQTGNPLVDLADTPVVIGSYNPTGSVSLDQPETSVAESGTIHQTVNTTEFTVDRYGRLTYAVTAPISTAREGTLAPVYDNATAYARYDKVKNGDDRLYEAILPINAGGGEPTHTDTSDTGSWRYLGSALTPQKGLASFSQEDFDVTEWDHAGGIQGGYVKIAERGVDNLQLQNNRIGFADGNTVENFELDQELTATTGYRGFNYLNYVKVNDTSGNLLFGANNTGDSGAGEIDVNVRSYFSDPNIDLDGALDQLIDKYGDGNLDIFLTQNSASNRQFSIASTNTGTGQALLDISADNDITIYATDVNSRVNVEDYHFQDNVLSTTNSTMVLDPNDDDDVTGLVRIRGDLQVDGTTTTVNSVTTTIQDPIITLGGEDTLTLDDNLDRGIEFRYYDSQERFGFFGWDEDYADANIWNGTGGYRFLYNATNTNEVYTGTDAALIAGNLRLTTNTGSTSTTTGTLVVTGGVGISENVYVGGTVDIANDFDINSGQFTVTASNGDIYTQGDLTVDSNVTLGNASTDTVLVNSDTTFEDDVRIVGPNTVFSITDGTTERFVIDTDNGNIHSDGTLDVDSGVTFNSTLDVDGATTLNNTLDVDGNSVFHNNITLDTTGKYFKITNGVSDKFTVLSTNGNTNIEGTLDVTGNVTLTNNLTVNGSQTTIGNSNTDILTVNADVTFTDNLTVNQPVDFDSTLNVDGAVDFNNTLTVDGTTTVFNDVLLRAANKSFQIQDGASNTQLSVDYDNGNTVIGRSGLGTSSAGTLTVHGNALFETDVTINATQTTIGNANTDALTVNAVSTFTDNVTVNGDLEVDQNVIINQNLTVHGTTTTVNSTVVTLDDPIVTLGGDTAPTSSDGKDRGVEFRYYANSAARVGFYGWDESASRYAFYHNATNSSEVFNGTRSGIDAGSIKLFDATNATSSSTGALIVGGGASVGIDLYVGDDLVVADAGSFGGNVDITGTLDVTDDFAINTNKFTVDAQTGNTVIDGTFLVRGNSTIGNAGTDAHTVNGTVQFNHALTGAARANIRDLKIGTDAANEIGTLAGNLILDSTGGTVNVTDNLDVDLDLNVDGNTKIDGTLTVDGNTTIGNAGTDAHTVTGTVQFNQALTGAERANIRDIKIGTDAANEIGTLAGNLILDSFAGKVHITDNAEVDGFLKVDGNTTLGDAVGDTLTVNATSTFNAAITSTDITADSIKIGVDASNEISTTTGNLILDSAAGTVNITDNADVDGNLNVDGNTQIDGTLTVDGNVTLGNAGTDVHVVTGTVTFNNAMTATDVTIDNITIGVVANNVIDTTSGNLTFQSFGGTVYTDANHQVNQSLTVLGNTIFGNAGTDTHTFTGTTTFNNFVDINGGADIDGIGFNTRTISATGGSLVLDSSVNNVQVTANLGVSDNLTVSDSAVLGSSSADSLTVNAISTFTAPITSTNLTADSIKIGVDANNEISTLAGNLILDSFTGETVIDDNLTVNGTLDVDGTTIITDSVFVRADNQQFAVQTAASVTVFSVDSDNGNTVIAGTFNVNGASVIDDTLNVTGAVDFDSTLTVDGIQSITNTTNASTGSSFSSSGALRVAGGVSIARDLAVGEDFKVYGDFEVDGNVVQKGNQEFRGRVEFSKNENPTSLADDAPIMITSGGMTVTEDVYIGQSLFLGANNATKITVDGVTGNGSFSGTLGVTGITTLTTLNATSVTTTGNIASGGNLSVGGSNFIVTAANGNTSIAGTLGVTGATTLTSTLNVQAATDLDSTLNVDGAATFNNTITQNSTSLFKDNFVLRGASKTLKLQNGSSQDRITLESTTGNITAAGLITTNTLDVTTNTTIGGTLGVTGQITGNVTGDLTGTADKTDLVNITETASSDLNYFIPFVSTNTGYTEVRTDSQNLSYNPSTNTMTVNNFKSTTNFEVQGNLNVTGNVTYGQSQVGSIANHDTDALAEGTTNLYFTDERVDDRVAALIAGGTGISASYDDVGNLLTLSAVQADLNTDNFTEGSTNLFTTAARTRTHFTYGTGIEHDGSGTLSVTQSDINTDNVTEGSTNIFFTQSRARGAFSASGDLNYNASTGDFSVTLPTQASLNVDDLITLTGRANGSTHLATFAGSTISDNNTIKGALGQLETAVEANASNLTAATGSGLDLSQKSTTDLSEGNNLYFTNERVDDRVAALISAGTGISSTYDDSGNLLTLSAVPGDFDTDDISEGTTNLYYTDTRADARIALQVGANLDLSQKSTTNLSEGNNLYYTDTRADARIALAAPNYATAAQGTLADSATQPGDDISTLNNDSNFITSAGAPVQSVAGKTGTVSLVKGDVGLGNVDNTSDANKPVSTAQQTALDLKADLASPALTGTPTAPTAAQATNTTQVATTAFVQSNLTASLLRAALGIPEYASDGLATAGGLAAGDVYYNTVSSKYTTV
jgi:hypothetical protein